MIRLISVGTLVAAVWLSTSLLAWVDVRDFHSDESALIGTLIGSELNPLTSLVPLIVLLISLIARYRLLSRTMAAIASIISGFVIVVMSLTSWSDASAVIELISSTTGLATAAGFGVVVKIGYWVYLTMAGVTGLIFALAVFQPGRSKLPDKSSTVSETNADPENLWDEQ
ncbi:MAG: hypothetical protein QMB74_03325 [Aquiluna sp.]|jgi:hypothetical protein